MTSTSSTTIAAGRGRARQGEVYRAGVLGRRPKVPVDVTALERRAEQVMSDRAWAYVSGGAGAGLTMASNRAAFTRWSIVPRMLAGRTRRDLGVELFGRTLPTPLLLSPVGAAGVVRRESDTLAAAAAASLDIPFVISSQGCSPMEDVAAAMGSGPRWYQLYWSTDEQLVDSMIARAEAIGCDALVVTVDTTMLGWRPMDLGLGSLPFARGIGIAQYTSDPRFLELVAERVASPTGPAARVRPTPAAVRSLFSITSEHPGRFRDNLRSPVPRAAVEAFLDIYSNPGLGWDDLATLRHRTRLPVLVKGVLHPDDARRAVEAGASGVVVSNHGGRQVDGALASLDALPGVREAVGRDTVVVLDSGVRTGADVLKALALGADVVGIGRPWVYGLALAGRAGVREVLANLVAELDLTMGLSGVASVRNIAPDLLTPTP
jgi:isopentenyl diphosphate isomerase/L-lactate dehydrogenase-like FMN-dependent dehydrogenase